MDILAAEGNVQLMKVRFIYSIVTSCLLLISMDIHAESMPVMWTNSYDGGIASNDVAAEAFIDVASNLVIAGQGESTNGLDAVIIKCAPDGGLLWRARYDGESHRDDLLKDAALDSQGNTCLCIQSMTTNGDSDIVLVKYDTTGQMLWEYRYNGTGFSNDIPVGCDLDSSNDIYVGGVSVGTNGPGLNMITFKCTSGGSNVWLHRFASPRDSNQPGDCYVNDLACDSTGQVYITGGYRFHSNYSKSFKLSPLGDVLWDIELSSRLVLNDQDELFVVDGGGLRKANPTNAATVWQFIPQLPYGTGMTIKEVMFSPFGDIYLAGDYNQTKIRYLVLKLDAGGTQRWYSIQNFYNVVSGHQRVVGACQDPFTNAIVVGNIGFIAYGPTGLESAPGRGGLSSYIDIVCDAAGYVYVIGSLDNQLTGSDIAVIKLAPNPTDDLDGDGLPNCWETQHFGDAYAGYATNDNDGDGWNNEDEFVADSAPTSSVSRPAALGRIVSLSTNVMTQIENTSTLRTYDILAKEDLTNTNANWQVATETVTGTGGSLGFVMTNSPPQGFYRLRIRVP